MFKRALLGLFLIVVIAFVAVAGSYVYIAHETAVSGPLTQAVTIVIPKGERTLAIGAQLEGAHIVGSRYLFAAGAHLGPKAAIEAGEYEISAASSVNDIVALLRSGRVVVHRLTIPEGLTNRQIAALIEADTTLVGETGPLPAEGTIWPDTYKFILGETRAGLLRHMNDEAVHQLQASWALRDTNAPLANPHDALVLASIVEKETGVPAERPHVAAVFENRLRLGMKLQSDPTVIYALSDGLGVLPHAMSHEELMRPSPYNTYLIAGLPPEPICNPGKAALEATLHPVASRDIYFVATGIGGHAFAETMELHNKNVAAYIRTLHDQRQAIGAPKP